jgi:ceramidase
MHWSEPIDLYCERTSPAFWAEPVNAASNIAFLIAAYAAWRLWRRAGTDDPFVPALIVLAAVVGLGSFAFHTLATRGAALLDVIPIALFVHAYLLFALIRFVQLRVLTAVLIVVAFFVAAWAASGLLPAGLLNQSGEYLPILVALIVVGSVVRTRPAGRAILVATAVFAVSLTFRTIDIAVCDAFPLGTHFVWHVLNAVVIYILLRAAVVLGSPAKPGGNA